jgi:hypothetical protein
LQVDFIVDVRKHLSGKMISAKVYLGITTLAILTVQIISLPQDLSFQSESISFGDKTNADDNKKGEENVKEKHFEDFGARGLPSFKIHGYSRTNVPEMSVTFENGVSYDLVLEPGFGSCNFIGTLKDHPSTTAVTGCLNKPGDKMHITLISELNTKSAIYEMDFDGRLKALENPFKHQRG